MAELGKAFRQQKGKNENYSSFPVTRPPSFASKDRDGLQP